MNIPLLDGSRVAGAAPSGPWILRPFHKFAGGWRAFWFTPADPTTLGLLRLTAGVVLLIVLLQTTALLPVLYAPDAMLDAEVMNQIRLETPTTLPPAGWEDPNPAQPPRPAIQRPELMNAPNVVEYRNRWGMDPAFAYDAGMPGFSPYFHLTDVRWVYVVHWLFVAVAVLFTLGVATRVTSVLAWFVGLSVIHRGLPSSFGMDAMLALGLLYLMLGPSGAALSVDRLFRRYRKAHAALGQRRPVPDLAPEPSIGANIVIRLLQIHFCIIYIMSGTAKMQGAAWWNGTALWQTMSNYEFAPARFGFFTDLLRATTSNRLVWEVLFTFGGSVFTLVLEVSLPFLIWHRRWRWLMVIGAVMLHTGIALTMGLVSFSMMMLVIVGSFLPPELVKAFVDSLLRRPYRAWLVFSSRPDVGLRTAGVVKALDLYDQVKTVDVAQNAQPEVNGTAIPEHLGKPLLIESVAPLAGYALAEKLVRSMRLLWPVALLSWVPGVGRLGRVLWPAEAAQRQAVEVGG